MTTWVDAVYSYMTLKHNVSGEISKSIFNKQILLLFLWWKNKEIIFYLLKQTNHTVRKFPNYVELFRSSASEAKGMQFWYQFIQISLSTYKMAIPLCNSKEKACQPWKWEMSYYNQKLTYAKAIRKPRGSFTLKMTGMEKRKKKRKSSLGSYYPSAKLLELCTLTQLGMINQDGTLS